MAITFRDLKDAALSHVEMDTNLASYYLSSSVSGRTITFYKSGSDGIVISSSLDLSDSDNQTLSIEGDELSILNGNSVTIPTGSDTTYSAGTGLTLDGTVFSFTGSLFSGDYEDLTNKPTLFDGDYNSLSNLPTIPTVPTNVSAFTNDAGYITSSVGTLYTAGDGLDLVGTEFVNIAPDQTVSLTGQGSITITGTYPNFTISGSDTNVNTEYTAGTGLTLNGTEFSLTDPHFSGDYNDLINTPDVSLSLDTNNLTLTKLDGTTNTVDLTPYLDADARAIDSGILDGATGIVTFTRDDATTFTLDLSDLLDDTNLVTSVNGLNGVVVLTTDNVAEGTTNLYDKEVSLTGQNITINGTYPNFQLTGSNGSVTSVNGQTGDVTLTLFDGDYNSLSNLPTLFDGSYNSLTDIPTLFDGDYNSLSNLPTLFDGDYNSLTNLPTIPTVPTNVSEFTNDAGYITGYTEVDTLATVTGRNSTTSTSITAANFITTSDERLKSSIKPIASGLETLKKFVSYEYVKDGKQDAGFIAQEVQQAIPYSVFKGQNGYLTMSDRPILAHMHKAILELEARLAAIESKLD